DDRFEAAGFDQAFERLHGWKSGWWFAAWRQTGGMDLAKRKAVRDSSAITRLRRGHPRSGRIVLISP
ncbi:hypothetical protein R0K18_36925, partial [Pantoea sp. SIMBA_133]